MAIDLNSQPIYNAPTVIAPPTAQAVYSSPNITQAVTAPVAKPNLSDPYALQDYYMNSPEMQAAKASVQAGQNQINQVNQALRTTTTALENQNIGAMGSTGASVNLIGGQTARARSLAGNELSALGETQNANLAYLNTLQSDAQNKYAIAQQERSQLQDLIRTTGGKAGISYADSYESALSKANDYTKKIAEEEKKTAYKDNLKSTALSLGIKTKGKSTSDIEKALKKYYKSEKEYKKTIQNLELSAKQKSLAGSGTSDTAYAKKEKELFDAVDSWKEKMGVGKASWSDAFSSIQGRYGLSPDTIDNLLGLNNRDLYDN